MLVRDPIETPRGRVARRLLLVLVLALLVTVATTGAAVASSGHAAGPQRSAPAAEHVGTAAAEEAATDGPSPLIPLIFAGILFLAVAFPALPRHYSRYGPHVGERW